MKGPEENVQKIVNNILRKIRKGVAPIIQGKEFIF